MPTLTTPIPAVGTALTYELRNFRVDFLTSAVSASAELRNSAGKVLRTVEISGTVAELNLPPGTLASLQTRVTALLTTRGVIN